MIFLSKMSSLTLKYSAWRCSEYYTEVRVLFFKNFNGGTMKISSNSNKNAVLSFCLFLCTEKQR